MGGTTDHVHALGSWPQDLHKIAAGATNRARPVSPRPSAAAPYALSGQFDVQWAVPTAH